MTYATIEASPAEGRPYFLYQFVEGDQLWRFTSRATEWTSPASSGEILTWEPAAVAHGDVMQTSEIDREQARGASSGGSTCRSRGPR